MVSILLVEDNHDMLATLTEALEMNNHLVHIARHGQSGLDSLRNNIRPDLIITDINMPHMDGLEFLGHVRGSEKWRDIPTIVMSGLLTDRPSALDAGADGFIVKPFKYQELDALMKRVLGLD